MWGFRRFFRRRDRDAELADEIRFHLEQEAQLRIERGEPPEDAAAHARRDFGNVGLVEETTRDVRAGRLRLLRDANRDLQYAIRLLRRTPGYTAVAVLTLALGIGANTAIFSVLNGVILQPLAYPHSDQLMRVTAQFDGDPSGGVGLSYPEYAEFRQMTRSFSSIGAFTVGRSNTGGGSGAWSGEVNITAGNRPLRVRAAAIDEHLLHALAVKPAEGRFFAPGETDAMPDRPGLGGPPIVIVSYELWQSAFGGQPLVGQSVTVDGRAHDVIGIMPRGVDLMDARPQIWLPLGIHPVARQLRNGHLLSVIGRLKPGVTPQMARTELNLFQENWGERVSAEGHVPVRHPARSEEHSLALAPLQDAIVGHAGRAIWVLQAAAAFLLLIACVNLANISLARAESRRREFAVRAALGAGRGRLFRQTMTEGLLLAAAGGTVGVWLAHFGVQSVRLLFPDSLPRTSDVAVDGPVLLFATAIAALSTLLFGLTPAALTRSVDLLAALKESSTGVGRGRRRVRRVLVSAEVALAVILVVGAGLLVRTVYNLTRVDAGFDRAQLVTFSMTLPRATEYPGGRTQVYQQLMDALRALPGVESATAMSDLPLHRVVQGFRTQFETNTAGSNMATTSVDYYQFVMSDYFRTLAIPIVAGRAFEPGDTISLERVVIVSETLANRLWKGDAIGRRLRPNLSASMGTSNNPWHRVVGVARDVRAGGVHRPAGTEMYLLIEQPAPPIDGTDRPWVATAPPTLNVVLRTGIGAATLAGPIERAVRNADSSVPIVRLREMDEVFAESIGRPRLLAHLLGTFAGLALLLALLGTYGVLSYMVAQRRREIAIRMALGADRWTVMALIMKQGLAATAAGLLVGVAGAIALNRLMSSLLFGVGPTDAATVGAVAAAMMASAAVACWLPARRASFVDPNDVLRAE